jgi:hypothetical protein
MGAGVTSRTLAMMMGHALGWQIAFVHALGAVLAWRAPVFVDALCLALAAAHTRAAGPEGSRADHARRHDDDTRGFPGAMEPVDGRVGLLNEDGRCENT